MNPILSIAIPTHNRSQYLVHCLSSLLEIEGDFEIIVSDTSDDGKFAVLLQNEFKHFLGDSRLKYINVGSSLSMTENLNNALSFCTGHYVTFIGDDDTLAPNCIHYLKLFRSLGIEIVSPDVVLNYAWPDFSTLIYKNAHKSRLYFDYKKPYLIKVDTKKALLKARKNCFQGTDGLPKLYHGFVTTEVLKKIKNQTGQFLHGSTPDMSAAIGLCFVSDYFIRCNFPLTIPGASGMSNTGRAAQNKHLGKIEEELQTSRIEKKSWFSGIPKYFSVEIVWAQAGLQTENRFDPTYLKNFPFIKFLALCYFRHPTYYNHHLDAFLEIKKNNIIFDFILLIYYYFYFFLKYSIRYFRRALNPSAANGKFYIGKIDNVKIAQTLYRQHSNKKLNFDDISNFEIIKNIGIKS